MEIFSEADAVDTHEAIEGLGHKIMWRLDRGRLQSELKVISDSFQHPFSPLFLQSKQGVTLVSKSAKVKNYGGFLAFYTL